MIIISALLVGIGILVLLTNTFIEYKTTIRIMIGSIILSTAFIFFLVFILIPSM
ncbi:MAG: hypothetical protein RR840_04600 [Clostridium sp.]